MRVPTYRLHKPSGNAVATFAGRDFYLGEFGSEESRKQYDRRLAEWLAAGRAVGAVIAEVTVAEVCLAFFDAKVYPDTHRTEYAAAITATLRLYGSLPVNQFGPLALQAVRAHIESQGGIKRKTLNNRIHNIRRVIRWGVGMEMVAASTLSALMSVESVKSGDTDLDESEEVVPVPDSVVSATLPHLTPTVRDMVQVQRLTGLRSEELCTMRPDDVDRSESIWVYTIKDHKTAHHNVIRAVAIGPQSQAILSPYFDRRRADQCVFSPKDSDREKRDALRAKRKTPPKWGNSVGTNRRPKVENPIGDQYTPVSYRNAVYRACDKLHPAPPEIARRRGESEQQWKIRMGAEWERVAQWRRDHRWKPHQLRHAFATETRETFDLDHAQKALGHTHAKTSEIYARLDLSKAKAVAEKIG